MDVDGWAWLTGWAWPGGVVSSILLVLGGACGRPGRGYARDPEVSSRGAGVDWGGRQDLFHRRSLIIHLGPRYPQLLPRGCPAARRATLGLGSGRAGRGWGGLPTLPICWDHQRSGSRWEAHPVCAAGLEDEVGWHRSSG